MNEQLTQLILKVFAKTPFDSLNHKQISARIGATTKKARQEVIRSMQQLAEQGMITEDEHHQGRFHANLQRVPEELIPKNFVVGTIDMKQTGKAYVIPTDEGMEDVLIAAPNTAHALHGDTVRVLMFPRRNMHKPEGQVVEILQRARTRFVGVVQRQSRFAFVVCDSRNMPTDIFIPLDDLMDAEEGEKVVVEMTDWPERMNNPVGRVVKRLGTPGDNNVEMQSILAEYDFPLEFPEQVETEAKKMRRPTKKEIASRRDMRDAFTFTIDPADAKDFDDALSYRPLPGGKMEVGVHIADVSHYVKPGTAIDDEAYLRGTSIYMVDRTIPMLPEKLCNDLCSLRQGEDKLTFSVVMQLDKTGKVLNTWMGRTVINSNHRLAYEQAQSIIEAGAAETPSPTADQAAPQLSEALLALHGIATRLRSARFKAGAINFEKQEVKFILDAQARPVGVYIQESKEANWLVEEFMLLANRLVAEKIGKPGGIGARLHRTKEGMPTNTGRTFVYRVHDEPNPEKLSTFVQFVDKLGFKIKTGTRKALADSYNQLFEHVAGRGEQNMIDSIAIRTMSKACYSTDNIGHYGLGFPYYTHFTSPIRRYPDLLVHRLLAEVLANPDAPNPPRDVYEEYCRHLSATEKRAADAERASVKYKQAEYLAERIGQVFPALISGVSKWGVYAELQDNKCEGMIPIATLKDDYYMLDEDNYQVIGRRTGKTLKLGYPVTVRVKRVDMLKKQIDLELVDEEEERRKQARLEAKKKQGHRKTQIKRKKS